MSKVDKLRAIIRETIKEVLEEMTVTGDVAGYNTPYAFTGGSAAGESKRKKSATNSTGFMVVDGFEDGEDKADTLSIDDESKPEKDSIENRKKKISVGQRKSLDESINEGKYHNWRNDPTLKPKQKIGRAIREANNMLSQIDEMITMSSRLKTEAGVQTSDYWKNTNKALLKIETKLVKIINNIKNVR